MAMAWRTAQSLVVSLTLSPLIAETRLADAFLRSIRSASSSRAGETLADTSGFADMPGGISFKAPDKLGPRVGMHL